MRFTFLILMLIFSLSYGDELPTIKGIILTRDPVLPLSDGVHIHIVSYPGTEKDLVETVEPFLGHQVSEDALAELKRALISYYLVHHHPLVDVRIPPQDITEGRIVVLVTESALGQVQVKENQWFHQRCIEEGIRCTAGASINTKMLIEDVMWINRNPFRQIDIVFTPGETPKTTDIELLVCDKFPFSFYLGTDNYGTELSGVEQFVAGFNWGNVFGWNHLLSYQYTASYDFHRLHSHAFRYAAPTFCCGHEFALFGGYYRARGKVEVVPEEKKKNEYGEGLQASVRYRMPFRLCPPHQHEWEWGFDFKRMNSSFLFGGMPEFSRQSVVLTQVMMGYYYSWESSLLLSSVFVEAYGSPLKWLPNQSNRAYDRLRRFAKNTYIYTRAGADGHLHLPYDFSLYSRMIFQAANQNLLPTEQFGLGGYDSVRGYAEREVTGDNALLLSTEVRTPPILCDAFILLGFVDYGIAWNHKLLPDEKANQYLIGIGPGLRCDFSCYLTARLDWGFQLHKTELNRGFHQRFNFSVMGRY